MIERVIIVDTHEGYRAAARCFFEARGTSVAEFSDGGEAVRYLDREGGSVDAVLTDLNLPTLDGIALLKHSRLRHPSVAIAVVTALKDPRLTEYLNRIGAAQIFLRSTPLEDIYRELSAFVRNSAGATENAVEQ